MNPGMANLLAIVSGNVCERIDSVRVLESVDSTGYDSPETELQVGFGRRIDDPELPAMTAHGTAVFADAVYLMADALGLELDDVVLEATYAHTTHDVVMDSWTIAAGCVAGISASWKGIYQGRTVIDLAVRWRKGRTLEPDWKVEHGYVVEIEGLPCVRTKMEVFPPKDFVARSFSDYMVLGMIMTAMPAINAIPHTCDAAPGIVTYTDLPLISPRGWVPSS